MLLQTNWWHPQPTMFVARIGFAINERHWLRPTVNHILVSLTVSAGVCTQGIKGLNPADD